MNMLILLFVALIFVSGIIINGWYAITRGRWELNPDGTKFWTGKIFNGFHKFLEQHIIETKVYQGEQFVKEFSKVLDFFKADEILIMAADAVEVKEISPKRAALLYTYAASKNVIISLQPYVNEKMGPAGTAVTLVSFLKEVPKYKIHYLIADPLGLCLTCMSSFYGTALWIIWYFLMREVNSIQPNATVSLFLDLSIGFKIGLWILFCISLAYVNDTLFNIKKYFGKD